MPDLSKLFESLMQLLEEALHGPVPVWMRQGIALILLGIPLLLAVLGLLVFLSKIKKTWNENFRPRFYTPEEKQHTERRRRYADHIESEIRRLNSLESWSDYRFAELEAEVEAEGRRQAYGILSLAGRTRSGLRRERSLSKALEKSRERLILLEGEPGSGKSVALRHVAQSMAQHAMKAHTDRVVIPIFVNLKELSRRHTEKIDGNLIRSFIFKSMNRVNDRDIEEFLETEFDLGLQRGTWFFLLDSFDELPEILSSVEADKTIRSYADAISDFLHGMNQCRGVVASRQFRGPGQLGWPRFWILPLSEERRFELIRKGDLGPELASELTGRLGTSPDAIRTMASNPMFLGLLCEHMHSGHAFPNNAHSVFETYIATRLKRDTKRLEQRFNLTPDSIRNAAEAIAFCMAADPGLGLNPTRLQLNASMSRLGFKPSNSLNMCQDALEFLKLARSEIVSAVGESRSFTFAHRRFQEYFATCVVLREPQRVSAHQLLIDARWRETTVVLCQTQRIEELSPILAEAKLVLEEMIRHIPGLVQDPVEYLKSTEGQFKPQKDQRMIEPFIWPVGALHVLGLLQEGFSGRLSEIPDDISLDAARLVLSAQVQGMLPDKKWGLEVAGVVPSLVLLYLVKTAFTSKSEWLKEVAYRQVSRLKNIPVDIAQSIHIALMNLLAEGRLGREWHATYAHMKRLEPPSEFVSTARFLLRIPWVDSAIHIVILLVVLFSTPFTIRLLFAPIIMLSMLGLRPMAKILTVGLDRPDIIGMYPLLLLTMRLEFILVVPLIFGTWGILLFILTLWTPLALAVTRTSGFVGPFRWLLMPIWPYFYLARNLKAYTSSAFRGLGKNWKTIVLLPFFVAFLLLLATSSTISRNGFLIFVSGIGFLVLLWIANNIYGWASDSIRLRKWLYSHHEMMTAKQYLLTLQQFATTSVCIQYVKATREKNLLLPSSESIEFLQQLVIALENATGTLEPAPIVKWYYALRSTLQHELQNRDLSISNFVRRFEIRLRRISPDLLDEVCKSLEKLRNEQRSTE
jgi:hypothetical protein